MRKIIEFKYTVHSSLFTWMYIWWFLVAGVLTLCGLKFWEMSLDWGRTPVAGLWLKLNKTLDDKIYILESDLV